MLTITFVRPNDCIVSKTKLYQWDKNQYIEIGGIDGTPDVHFTCHNMKYAYVVNSELLNGKLVAKIPNTVLTFGKDIIVYICPETGDSQATTASVVVPVTRRNIPEDYAYDSEDLTVVDRVVEEMERAQTVEANHDERISALEALGGAIVPGEGGAVNVDKTLTLSGYAADAKTTGDKLKTNSIVIETLKMGLEMDAAGNLSRIDRFESVQDTIVNAIGLDEAGNATNLGDGIQIDATLEESGKAADAKVVGDRFASHSNQIFENGMSIASINAKIANHSLEIAKNTDAISTQKRKQDTISSAIGLDANGKSTEIEEAKELAADAKTTAELARADVKSTEASMQNQIDNLVLGTDSGAEVTQARVTRFGANHDTLKARLDTEETHVNDNLLNVYREATNAKNTTTRVIDIGEPDMYIRLNEAGEEYSTTALTHWSSKFVRIPENTTIHVFSPLANIAVAVYDKDKRFIDYPIGIYNSHATRNTYSFDNVNGCYLRMTFYDKNKYTDERHNMVKVFYYVDSNVTHDDLENTLKWDMLLYNDTTKDIAYSPTVIGTAEPAIFDHDVIITRNSDNLRLAVAVWDVNNMENSSSLTHFATVVYEYYVPAGLPVWIGVKDDNDFIKMCNDMSRYITIRRTTPEKLMVGRKSGQKYGGYDFMAYSEDAMRVVSPGFKYAEHDLKLHVNDRVYTCILYHGKNHPNMLTDNVGDYYLYYSKLTDIIIPAGTWYNYTVAKYHKDESGNVVEEDSRGQEQEVYDGITVSRCDVDKVEKIEQFERSVELEFDRLRTRLEKIENKAGINVIPDYYVAHVANKVNAINAITADAKFAFITDVHLNGYVEDGGNAGNSKSLLNYITKHTDVSMVINGGDLVNNTDNKRKNAFISEMLRSAEYSKPDNGVPQFVMYGNHDTGIDTNSALNLNIPAIINVNEFMVTGGISSNRLTVTKDIHSPTQYYIDDDTAKMRYIVTNMSLSSHTDERFVDTWCFFADALNSTPEGYQILAFAHVGFKSTVNSDGEHPMHDFLYRFFGFAMERYNERSARTYSDIKKDFSKGKGEAIGIVVGHSHCDFSLRVDTSLTTEESNAITIENHVEADPNTTGILIIGTTCDNAGAQKKFPIPVREIGTVSEQAFDVFSVDKTNRKLYATRIGAGNDRVWSY